MTNCDPSTSEDPNLTMKNSISSNGGSETCVHEALIQLIAALAYSEPVGSEWQADKEKPRLNSDNRHAESSLTGER